MTNRPPASPPSPPDLGAVAAGAGAPGAPDDRFDRRGDAPGLAPPASAFDRVALRMTSTLDLDEVLAAVTIGLVEEIDVALARIWLLDEVDDALHLRASSGLSTRLDGNYRRVAVGALKIGFIAASGEPVTTNDVAHDPRIADHAWAAAEGLVSFAGWPLRFRGERLGVLATFARRALGEAELSRLALFANQAAIAIKNARLFAEVDALSARLRADNAYLRAEAATPDDAMRDLEKTPGLAAVVAQLRDVAPTPTSVLVHGETGTGKELVARAVHEASARRERPFVRVNCAALSAALIESELFGHERGAYTGALQRRLGRFELAHGGTLFLDEIGELPLEVQPKLLRVLQERELERVGGTQTVRVDVRIVAATNRDLAREVEAGRFRADLYYRLAVFPIEVPPLRARKQDIEPLAQAFAVELGRRVGKAVRGLSAGARARLLAYDWPGNVRELYNVIERASIVARREVLDEGDLPPLAAAASASPAIPAAGALATAAPPVTGDASLEAVERTHILRVLEQTNGVVEGSAGAARLLGLAPSTLRSRMAQLGIRRGRPR
ncbi:MAG TPA: sigma 54-interacting transcriptional regulator [Polyangiaceae bacterium]|nr:sigma 54-interacting transcriptional regulator [Polyangiaceae bacterium]